MNTISCVYAREILDSRGNPTVEVDVMLSNGILGRAQVPSGASTGEREALELRDNDQGRFWGKGVLRAVKNVNDTIAPKLIGKDVCNQRSIDFMMIELDGTENKSNLGANAILGVSLAVAKAAAQSLNIPLFQYFGGVNSVTLPVPFMNVLNGGAHADNNLDIQEFMIVPVGAKDFPTALRMGVETFHTIKNVLKSKGYNTNVGDEGGFAPALKSNEEAIEILISSIEKAGYDSEDDIVLALDSAASEFYCENKYVFSKSNKNEYSSEQLVELYAKWVSDYPIISIEDGLGENDWDGWKIMTSELGKKVQIVGDDIFVTNPNLISKGIKEGISNSVLIKLNQIGSVTETLEAVKMAKDANYSTVISHRSGETEDSTIADFTVGINAGMIKTGSASRSERMAKYNQLLRINELLGENACFAGKGIFKRFNFFSENNNDN